jgi:hypothetical protein
MHRLTWPRATIVLFAFFGLALLQAWPLPLYLSSQLTGPPSGDTGVYVWNTWVFRHELVDNGAWPLWTSSIFAGDEPANLGHHNYTLFANLLAVPLQIVFDVVASFNLIYLINIALAGFGMFLLARRVTTHDAEAWLAGALFACCGFMVGRSFGHFSLVAAAPLPFFVWCLIRCWERRRTRDALALGLVSAWSITADPYYAVYCLMLGMGFLVSHTVRLTPAMSRPRVWKRALTICAVLAAVPVAVRLLTGGGVMQTGPWEISVRSLYTPVLILTFVICLRALVMFRIQRTREPWPQWVTATWLVIVAVASAGALAAPVLSAQVFGEAMDAAPVLWRSGPQGADLLALLLPHAAHPLMPEVVRTALAQHPGGLIEQSASLSMVALLVIGLAWWRTSWRPSMRWLAAAVAFGLMTMGPFIYVAGVNTYIPTPWTLLRYVPVISDARMPSRMAIVATMAVAMLFAAALSAWTSRAGKHRPWVLVAVALLLCVDLFPAPRRLYSAGVPEIYQRIAQDPRPVSVLRLPTGVRDGLASLGNFTAHAQFFQTVHEKRLIGGYLSRTTPRRRESHISHPVLGPLVALSGGLPVTQAQRLEARAAAAAFVREVDLGYVVINHREASPALEQFAVDVLKLTRVQGDADLSLYVPFGAARTEAGPQPRPGGGHEGQNPTKRAHDGGAGR